MSKPLSAQIDFAKRYLTKDSTFTAASAIQRLEELIEDIRDVTKVLQPVLNERFVPSFFEFTSYYKVGFVTCLEWHAKSRLYDMFCFDPKTIRSDDLKQATSNEKLISMIAEGLTIPHLLAGSMSISTKDSYIAAMDRVLSAIGAQKSHMSSILKKDKNGTTVGQVLEELYIYRNDLVHEIGLQTIGHQNIRDYTSFEEALDVGERVLGMILALENVLTNAAPVEFPNKLDHSGIPISEVDVLNKLIASMENKIEESVSADQDEILPLEAWQDEVSMNRTMRDKELQFIDSINIAGSRYYDTRPYIQAMLLKQRIQYLTLLSEQLL
ncbi:hypothetical protein [Brucella thiophenivorans]|uniref:Uncharacterized protein n=1 Tax=Brucella thiophenivorans TaxID=571255 RepID=A0A256FV20_9HYPH|nr:hypothetical protein [Brucella thiophenivorans]OYR18271.1 hypothetical protein CEV31_4283 [Brucella thiophenivorans]